MFKKKFLEIGLNKHFYDFDSIHFLPRFLEDTRKKIVWTSFLCFLENFESVIDSLNL